VIESLLSLCTLVSLGSHTVQGEAVLSRQEARPNVVVPPAAAAPLLAVPTAPSCFGPLTSVPLPENLVWPSDIRWTADQEVLISGIRTGILRLRIDLPSTPPTTEYPVGPPRTAASAPWSLAVSNSHLAIAPTHTTVGWKARKPGAGLTEDYFESIQDLDVRGDRLVLLGLRKTPDGKGYDEGGGYLWLGPLDRPNLAGLRPLAFSSDGTPARRMDACGPVGVGAVRFLADGSLVAVPLAEPGVLLFNAEGRLVRTWANSEFGLDEGCDVTEEMLYRLSLEVDLRMQWINQRRTIEDILPLGGDRFGLLVREHEKGATRWRLEVADSQGRRSSHPLALEDAGVWEYLRADVRAGRLALLQATRRQWNQKTPARPPRLFLAGLQGACAAAEEAPKSNVVAPVPEQEKKR
jgi:hypothetical protein